MSAPDIIGAQLHSPFVGHARPDKRHVVFNHGMQFGCIDWRHMDDVSAVGRTVYGERLNLCIWNKSNGPESPAKCLR